MDYQLEKQEEQSINRISFRVVLIALALLIVTTGCIYSEGWFRLFLIVLYYALTFIGYIAGRHFDDEIEASTGPIKRLSPVFGFVFTFVIAVAIHWWVFWE